MQQIVPALPCQLFKESTLDDYKSATFVLAKFAVSEACWLATGLNREIPCAVAIEAIEESAENGNGDNSSYVSYFLTLKTFLISQSRFNVFPFKLSDIHF